MNNLHTRILVVVSALGVVCGVAMVAIITFAWTIVIREISPYIVIGESRELTIDRFRVCRESVTGTDNPDSQCGSVFSTVESQMLYVCGDVSVSRFGLLYMLLYKDPHQRPIYANPVDDRFESGPFCRPIYLPADNQIGTYRVDVYHFRELVASASFEIR